jgi:uncharacterized RDD family membrane protein YckC
MESSTTCGICGLEARGREHPKLFGHVVHKKCKDKFVLNRELAWVIDALTWYMIVGGTLRFFVNGGVPQSQAEQGAAAVFLEAGLLVGFFFKDSVRGISLGKLVTGLQVVDSRTGEPIGPLQSLKRNLILAIPFMPIALAFQMRGGPRVGEGWAHTRVIQRAKRDQPAFAGTRVAAEDWSSTAR